MLELCRNSAFDDITSATKYAISFASRSHSDAFRVPVRSINSVHPLASALHLLKSSVNIRADYWHPELPQISKGCRKSLEPSERSLKEVVENMRTMYRRFHNGILNRWLRE